MPGSRTQAQSLRLLLVEDQCAAARRLAAALVRIDKNYRITHVTTLAAAVCELHGGSGFDVALVDPGLPDAAAQQAPACLCKHFPELALVVFAAEWDAALATDVLRLGAQDFLHKGVQDPVVIDRALRFALVRHRCVLSRHKSADMDQLTGSHPALRERDGIGTTIIPGRAASSQEVPSLSRQHLQTVAHELCNELNVVALEADVIQLVVGCGASVQVDQSVARIHQKCKALAQLVRQMQQSHDGPETGLD